MGILARIAETVLGGVALTFAVGAFTRKEAPAPAEKGLKFTLEGDPLAPLSGFVEDVGGRDSGARGDVPWGFLPEFLDGGTIAAATPVALPIGVSIAKLGVGALAPLVDGERVTFSTVLGGFYTGTVYEGVYEGPEDPAAGPAVVVVDRLAQKVEGSLVPGRYEIPASGHSVSHDRLDRVQWHAITPAEAGLTAFAESALPELSVGDGITIAARDQNFNTAAFVARILAISESGQISALMAKLWKVTHDEGEGLMRVPKDIDQATVSLSKSMLVNPSV